MKTVFNFEDVTERIKKALKINHDYELASLMNMKPTTFNSRKKSNSLPYEELLLLADTEKLNFNWLLTGQGNALNTDAQTDLTYKQALSPQFQAQEQRNHYRIAPKSWEEFELVPFYDVEASAGAGALVDQEQIASEMAFRRDWLKEMGLQMAHCALIKARGDSMEETIHDGDLLLVDTRIDAIKDDAIYIIQTDHVLIVKRVQHALDGSLIIISDNDKYENQTISPMQADKLKVAGRVRWYGHVL